MFSGDLSSLSTWDGNWLTMRPTPFISSASPAIELVANCRILRDSAADPVGCTVVSHPPTDGVRQKTYFFNWTSQEYELIDDRIMPSHEDLYEFTVSENSSRFVQQNTSNVRALLTWTLPAPWINYNSNFVGVDAIVFHSGE